MAKVFLLAWYRKTQGSKKESLLPWQHSVLHHLPPLHDHVSPPASSFGLVLMPKAVLGLTTANFLLRQIRTTNLSQTGCLKN